MTAPKPTVAHWVSVEDALPETFALVLVWLDDWEVLTGWFNSCGEWESDMPSVTHWAPLPDAPA